MRRKNKNVNNHAYKYRIYPTNEQMTLINKTFGCVRFVYNHLLDDRTKHYKEFGTPLKREVSYYKNIKEFAFLKEVDCYALCNAKLNLDTAFSNFFKKKSKYPKFHKKGKHDSYTTNNVNGNIRVNNNFIRLPKLGLVKTKLHRNIGKNEIIKSCTISRVAGKYYVSVLTEQEPIPVKNVDVSIISDDKVLGIDFSVPHFAVDNTGKVYEYPKFYRRAEKKLAKEQKRLSKKVYRSANYYKQLRKVQKLHQHIVNQRKDFLHKLSRELVNQYDVICFENLSLSALKRSLHFGKSISDEGFGMFRVFVKYKLEREGKHFVLIDKWFASTKICSDCGYKNSDITLKTTEWICPECGAMHQRDHNAAINIKREGLRLLTA